MPKMSRNSSQATEITRRIHRPRAGIVRMGSAYVPMDESLAFVGLDLSGRPYAVVQVDWHSPAVGGLPVEDQPL